MNSLKYILRWGLCMMILFILQKLFFVASTYNGDVTPVDIADIVIHGLKLDMAVTAYSAVLPCLLVFLAGGWRHTIHILRIYYIVVTLIMSLIIVADASLYPFWQFKCDASIFIYTDKPKDAIASVSAWYIVGRVVCFTVWMFMYMLVAYKLKVLTPMRKSVAKWTGKVIAIQILIFVLTIGTITLLIRGGIGQGTNNVSAAYYSDNQYLNHCAVNPVFNFIYSLGKDEDFSDEFRFFAEEERAEIMKGIYHTESEAPDSLLHTAKPDILLIVWEGCSQAVADCIGGPEGITPDLSRIASEGILFTNCYANSYRTDRGLVCLTAGWLGLPTISLMKIPQKSEQLPSLPRTLLNNGYKTTFWYAGDISFTNMGGYMHQAGFSRTISDKDFSASECSTEWGAPDEVLFRHIESDMAKQTSPTFDMVMTLSSHEPWDVPTKMLDDERENSFNYTDKCLGEFIARLQESPRWNNLLIIITADHGAIFEGRARFSNDIIHIPVVMIGGAIKSKRRIELLMNQADLAATLLGQLGISHDEFLFSRDILSTGYVYPTATFCYNNGVLFMDSTGTTVYDNDAARVIEGADDCRERKAKATLQTLYEVLDKQ